MNDNAKPIRIMATLALALQAFWTVMDFVMRMIPEPFLAMRSAAASILDKADVVRHPLLFVQPVLRLILVALFFYLLIQQCKKPTAFAPALTIIILAAPVLLFLVSTGLNFLRVSLLSRLYGTAELSALSIFNSLTAWTGIITQPVMPLLAAAAAYNWCRFKNGTAA